MKELLREAQKVYVERGEEKQKQRARIKLSTIEQLMLQGKVRLQAQGQWAPQRGHQKGQHPKGKPREKGRDKWYKCYKEGHFKREWPNWKKEEQVIPVLSFDEDERYQGLFYFMGSYQEPLINLEVRFGLNEITFLIHSRTVIHLYNSIPLVCSCHLMDY
jgi:hypothetical protein